jgi:desulfoferrodoxin-like iron-binding protein
MPDLGKRYRCPACGTAVLCLRPGPGVLRCCGSEMELARMESRPSGD